MRRRPCRIRRHHAEAEAVALRGRDDRVHRGAIDRRLEIPRHAEEGREVEMPEPERVHPRRRGDGVQRLQPPLRFDLKDQQVAGVRRAHLARRRTRRVAVMGEAEGGAAAPLGRIAQRLDGLGRGLGALDHRDHDPPHADVERAGDPDPLAPRHAGHRDGGQSGRGGGEGLEGLEPRRPMLHVVDRELRPGEAQQPRHAGGEELEHHRAGDRPAGAHPLAQRHSRLPPLPPHQSRPPRRRPARRRAAGGRQALPDRDEPIAGRAGAGGRIDACGIPARGSGRRGRRDGGAPHRRLGSIVHLHELKTWDRVASLLRGGGGRYATRETLATVSPAAPE